MRPRGKQDLWMCCVTLWTIYRTNCLGKTKWKNILVLFFCFHLSLQALKVLLKVRRAANISTFWKVMCRYVLGRSKQSPRYIQEHSASTTPRWKHSANCGGWTSGYACSLVLINCFSLFRFMYVSITIHIFHHAAFFVCFRFQRKVDL